LIVERDFIPFLEKYITLKELECDNLENGESIISVNRGNSCINLILSVTQTLALILILTELIFRVLFCLGGHEKLNFSKALILTDSMLLKVK
jgi:hypothetical protein